MDTPKSSPEIQYTTVELEQQTQHYLGLAVTTMGFFFIACSFVCVLTAVWWLYARHRRENARVTPVVRLSRSDLKEPKKKLQ